MTGTDSINRGKPHLGRYRMPAQEPKTSPLEPRLGGAGASTSRRIDMRRFVAWALGGLAYCGIISAASAQYYGYPQYPNYGQAPVYRVMPVQGYQPTQYYPVPVQTYPAPGGYYPGYYQQPLPQGYRPLAPMMVQQPMGVPRTPGTMTSVPLPATNRAGEPLIIVNEASQGKLPPSAPLAKALPSMPTTAQDKPAKADPVEGIAKPLPHSTPATKTTVVAEDCNGACTPALTPATTTCNKDIWDRDPEPACHWMAGGGVLYLRPTYADNSAFGSVNGLSEFNREWQAAPYGWVAFTTKCGLGARGRYWYLDQDLNLTQDLGNSEFVTAGNNLRMHVADVEGIYQVNDGPWSFLVGLGARWTDMVQSRDVRAFGIGGGESLVSSQTFRAVGPTLAIEASRACGRHFALYVNGRASTLFGTHHSNLALGGSSGLVFARNLSDSDCVPVFEVEAGAQYSVLWGHTNWVVRAGVTGQTWIDAGSSVSRSGSLDLVGGILQFGVAW